MAAHRYLPFFLLLWIVAYQVENAVTASFSNFNLETNWDTYLCANENPIVDEKTIILAATGLKSDNLPCIALTLEYH